MKEKGTNGVLWKKEEGEKNYLSTFTLKKLKEKGKCTKKGEM